MKNASFGRFLAVLCLTTAALAFVTGCPIFGSSNKSENAAEAESVRCQFWCEDEGYGAGWWSASRDKCFKEAAQKGYTPPGKWNSTNNCCCW